jgi:hypothetical protein
MLVSSGLIFVLLFVFSQYSFEDTVKYEENDPSKIGFFLAGIDLDTLGEFHYEFKLNSYFVNSMEVCLGANVAFKNIHRCGTAVSKSLRLLKVGSINTAHRLSFETSYKENNFIANEYPIDGLLFRLSYIYGLDGLQPLFLEGDPKSLNICILGAFSFQLTHLILMMNPLNKITYVSNKLTSVDLSLLERMLMASFNTGFDLNVFEAPDYAEFFLAHDTACDVIHARDPSVKNVVDLQHIVESSRQFVKVTDAPSLRTAIVVWERPMPVECYDFRSNMQTYLTSGNVELYNKCMQEEVFRSTLFKGPLSDGISEGRKELVGSRRSGDHHATVGIQWDYSGFCAATSLLNLTRYKSGLFASLYTFNSYNQVELFVGRAAAALAQPLQTTVKEERRSTNTGTSVAGAESVSLLKEVHRLPEKPPPLPPSSTSIVIIITYSNRVFDDTAYGLEEALRNIGYSNTCVMGDFDIVMYRSLLRRRFNHNCTAINELKVHSPGLLEKHDDAFADPAGESSDDDAQVSILQIVLGPNEPGVFTKNYVAFQVSVCFFSLALCCKL